MTIGLLGPLTVDGVDGALRRHDRIVLAALATRIGDVVSAEQLADALWGDQPPPTWPKVVQGCVVRLRKVLGQPAIQTTPHGYRLNIASDDVDIQRFERLINRGRELLTLAEPERAAYVLNEALDLWRGQPLIELDAWDTGRIEAGRLEELRRDAEELRVDAALRAGHGRDIVGKAQELTAKAPLRERRWALLALAQYQAGQQAEALRSLRQVRAILSKELGLDPSPELVALEKAILTQDPTLVVEAALKESSGGCPYRGLLPYGVADGDSFFGRSLEVDQCLARLATGKILAVVGPSGSGKSSLVRAGLGSALERDNRKVQVMTPGDHPADVVVGLPRPGTPTVLIVDQCEEAVSPTVPPEERSAFFAALTQYAETGQVVVTFRADRLGEISAYPSFARMVEKGMYLLGPMGPDQLRACIERPAHQAGLLIEPGLVDLLVLEVEGKPGALPLLSHALRETWAQREGRTLTVSAYQATGGIRGAVARSAEEVYADLSDDQRPIARDLLLRLVAPPSDAEPTRRRMPRRIFAADPERDDVIERLVRARLVTTDEGVLELAHEAIVRAWPRLQQWLADDAGGQQIFGHLSAAADSWDSMGRPASELYRGVRLAEALDWESAAHPDLAAVELAFLRASETQVEAELTDARQRAREARHSRTRTRRLAAGLAGALTLALIAVAVATSFQREASDRATDADAASTEADANRLAALSKSVHSLDLSLLLAAQALRVSDTGGTRDGLLDALVAHRRATQVVQLAKRPTDARFADSGRSVVIASQGEIAAWPVGSREAPVVVNTWGHRFDYIAASPTAEQYALWSYKDDTTPRIAVFDTDGTQRMLLQGFRAVGGYPKGLAFSPDGRVLFTSAMYDVRHGRKSSVSSYNVATGEKLNTLNLQHLTGPNEFPIVAISPDGGTAVGWAQELSGPATLLDLPGGDRVPIEVAQRPVDSVRYVPLPVGAAQTWVDGVVTIYRADGTLLQTLQAHRDEVTSIAMSPDHSWAVTGDRTGAVIVWDVEPQSGEWVQREVLAGHDGQVSALTIDPSSTTLLSAADDGTAITWDMSPQGGLGSPVAGLGDRWFSNRPAVVDPGRLLVGPTRPAPDAHAAWWQQTSVEATFVDPITGEVEDSVYVGDNTGSIFGSSASVSPDGTLIAITYTLGTAILDAATHEVVANIELDPIRWFDVPIPEPVWCSGWTPDGSKLLLCADGREFLPEDGNLAVVDTETWQVEPTRLQIGGAAQTIEVSPDETLIAVGMTLPDIDDPPPGSVVLLDATTLEEVNKLELGTAEFPYDLSFSPDSSRLAVGVDAGNLYTFDLASGQMLHGPARVNNAFVQQVEWLPDGRTVVTSGADGMVTLYDVERGLVRTTMPAATDASAGFTYLLSVTDQVVTAVAGDRPGRSYPLDTSQWLVDACRIVGRDLTPNEWASYLPDRPYERTCADLT